ncbi:unnamed protein product [Rhodiola kirilowii]
MSRGTYQVKFSGKTIETMVTDKASDADTWDESIRTTYGNQQIIVGLDCEWKPHPVRDMSNTTATLQLCVDTNCLILQLFFIDYIPQSIKTFLSDPNHVFVGVEVDKDVSKLRDEYGLICTSMEDIWAITESRYPMMFMRKPGLKALASNLVGLSMPKPYHVCTSNWQARVLNFEQIEYACIDAYCSFRIGHKLLKEN